MVQLYGAKKLHWWLAPNYRYESVDLIESNSVVGVPEMHLFWRYLKQKYPWSYPKLLRRIQWTVTKSKRGFVAKDLSSNI